MKIKFIGATDGVTGSKHLLITEKGKQILLDCGLYQGMGEQTDRLNRSLLLDPSHLEAVVLSHAHIDHSGALPYLVRQGFNGKIYCTEATMDVCRLLLFDSAHIQESDVHYINKRRTRKGAPPIRPIYTLKDAEQCMKRFKAIPFHTEFHLNDEISFVFTPNGHIIGSAAVNLKIRESGKLTRLTFTGDVGRYSDPLLNAPEPFPQADYIITESTYGNKIHEKRNDVEENLLKIVKHTCVEKKGKLIIPAFSLGRTQELLYVFDKLKNRGSLPKIKIYVDSPLSSGATKIVRDHPESFNDELKQYLKKDSDPFGFPELAYVEDANASKALNASDEPCIIISASGMAEAGRVKHHIKNSISDEKNTILISGFCAPYTLGARLLSGEKEVHIYGEFYKVKAEVKSILSLSAHGDRDELLKFLSCQDKSQLKSIFVVHGESEAKTGFKETLIAQGYSNVQVPEKGETFVLY